MHILETTHFILRQVTQDDVSDFVEFMNDINVMKFIGDGTWGGDKDVVHTYLAKNIASYKVHPHLGFWAVEDKQTKRVIGEAGLSPNDHTNEIEAGYMSHPNYWGKGYGTEILSSLIDYGFKNLNLNKIIAVAHPENHGSIKIMQKCGMIFEKMDWYHNRYSVKYSINNVLSITHVLS